MQKYFGQSAQDYFVSKCLKEKRAGTFVELGSNDPIGVNNTFLLEHQYGWGGLMIEYDNTYEQQYKQYRPKSVYIIEDATKINFRLVLDFLKFPKNIDYLSFDLEADNRSTLTVLEHFDKEVMDDYKFATVTFEHDIYRGDFFETRAKSREIFRRRGYEIVFPDVHAGEPYGEHEDWYVHPDLVDMSLINKMKAEKSLRAPEIVKILDYYSAAQE